MFLKIKKITLQKVLFQPKFLYTKDGYLLGTQEILTLDREAKTDLNLYPLLNLETAGKEELATLINQQTIKPKCVIANTIKGKGVDFMENLNLWHYRYPDAEQLEAALKQVDGTI
jgi:hypothetical protein